jgi:hypothetical protein
MKILGNYRFLGDLRGAKFIRRRLIFRVRKSRKINSFRIIVLCPINNVKLLIINNL